MKLLSFGEILWDVYENEKHIGGAPLNFAAHFAKQGGESYMISALGNDELGKSALDSLEKWDIKTDYISVLNDKETGKCLVTLNLKGVPSYNLLNDVAYDYIIEPDFKDIKFDAFYFGSLALRNENNRQVVKNIIKNNSFKEIFVDINIRKPYINKEAVEIAFENATIIKISDEELPIVTELVFGKEYDYTTTSKMISRKFSNIKLVIITLGEKGSFLYDCKNEVSYSSPAETVKVVSTVGAGDSFSATFLKNYLSGVKIEECLTQSSKISAFVVSKAEAIPEYHIK